MARVNSWTYTMPRDTNWEIGYDDTFVVNKSTAIKKQEEQVKNKTNLMEVRSITGETVLWITQDLKVEKHEKFTNQETATEFWRYINQYHNDPIRYDIADMKCRLVYTVGALKGILRDIDKSKLSPETLELIEKGLKKGEDFFQD